MKQLVEFSLEDEGSIVVEVEVAEAEYGEEEVSRLPKKAAKTFQDALSTAKPVAEAIINKLGDLSERPHEIGVEFGLKVSADADAIVASSGIEANFKVTLKWKRE